MPSPLDQQTSSDQRRRRFRRSALETDVSIHVFSASAALVGVCLTVIGIIKISSTLNPTYATLVDEMLAVDAFVFAASCLLAYSSLRSADRARSKRLESIADRLFLVAMSTMCLACGLIGFELF